MKILLVDDDAFQVALLKATLTERKFQVTVARSSAEALQMLMTGERDFASIISDINMPEGDGFAFLKSVRALDIKAPFFFISGDDVINEETALRIGSQGFMKKPVATDRLAMKIVLAVKGG